MSDEERIVPMRLQKFLARAGAASRRGSENLMTAGRVTVNGVVTSELGSKVDPLVDEVAVDGIIVKLSDEPVTLMLNKPKGVITTMSDPQGRTCVASLVPTDRYPGLYPIGRLDFDTTGLLLFSTDGELGHALLHPRRHVEKCYQAQVQGVPLERDLARLRRGIQLDDGMTLPAKARLVVSAPTPLDCSEVEICIHEGRKRQVRRMFDAIGHPVDELHRSQFGPISLGALKAGQWRELDREELAALYSTIDR